MCLPTPNNKRHGVGCSASLRNFLGAKTALRNSRDTIKTITDRTADLRRHKAIHDVLLILQGNFPQLQVALHEPDPKKCRDAVRMAALIMRNSWRSFRNRGQ